MRHYSFTSFYLSPIQQGIQGAHGLGALFHMYSPALIEKYGQSRDINAAEILNTWNADHKTMICLNGGMTEDLITLYNFLDTMDNPYPYAAFNEGEDALGGILTNVSIILPEKIYAAMDQFRGWRVDDFWMFYEEADGFSEFEKQLVEKISGYRLA